jgi:hypothetical protein
VPRKRLAMVLAMTMVSPTMAASAETASAASGSNDGEGEKAVKKAASGFTTQGNKRLGAVESS